MAGLQTKRASSSGGSTTTSSSASSSSDDAVRGIMVYPPIVHLVWGGALLVANLVGNMLQVESTQSWILGGTPSLRLDLSIWSQWPLFLHGGLTQYQNVAFIASWGAQFILMTSKIGTSFVAARSAQKHGTPAHKVATVVKEASIRVGFWNFLAWAIILFDSITDWNFANGLGILQQLFFVAVTFLMIFYCGTWGVMNIVSGVGRMRE
jgi:hypothetical protein